MVENMNTKENPFTNYRVFHGRANIVVDLEEMMNTNLIFNPSNAEATFVQTQRCNDFRKSSKPHHVGIY